MFCSPVAFGAIQYDSPGKDDRSQRSLNAEWVTVTNTGRSTVNLKGWTLTDRSHHTYTSHNLRLAPHQSVHVHTGIGRDTSHGVYQDRRDHVWNNNGDTATLRDSHGHVAARSWGHP
ncbi:lamin tail domain-containing protein [Streptomyces violascens]|uniref:lamin tail domain-containing protein n=1 Tax=Streptomyces violascens TaxID=67381 RepID=UPI00364DB8E1